MKLVKQLFCKSYDFWLEHFLATKNHVLVKFIDFFFGSACSYCMACRTAFFGFGVGFVIAGTSVAEILIGLFFVVLPVALTFGERKFCQLGDGSNETGKG